MAPERLSQRQLNRATLARQMLLERVPMSPYEAVRDLVGLQAQTPQSWYLSLWSRLEDFDPIATGRLIEDRRLVRIPVMRSTIHLVTDDDALALRSFTQPTIDRSLRGVWAQRLEGIDLAALVDDVRTFVGEAPRTPTDLIAHLDVRWPGRDRQTMTNAVRALVPLVQVPPRGVWRRSGGVKFAALEAWIGRDMPAGVNPEPIVLRYLAAFVNKGMTAIDFSSFVNELARISGETILPFFRTALAIENKAAQGSFDQAGLSAVLASLGTVDSLTVIDPVLAHADTGAAGEQLSRRTPTPEELPLPANSRVGRVSAIGIRTY